MQPKPPTGLLSRLKNVASNRLVDLASIDRRYESLPNRQERCLKIMKDALATAKINEGRLLEIGGRRNPVKEHFPGFDYTGLDLSIDNAGDSITVSGDITDCPQLPSASYDVIVSIDVFQHIAKPWLAAEEIMRLLKPGGVTAHSTLFSWRYHPCPIDYWRFSPEALKALFEGLKPLNASFDYVERRRNALNVSRGGVKPDELGGWRENVRVHYAGVKPLSARPKRKLPKGVTLEWSD